MEKINDLLKELTIKEKISLFSGQNFWQTKAIKRLNITNITVSDGPHGLRKQEVGTDNVGLNESIKATCFPTSTTLACSFDEKLLNLVGKTIATECRDQHVDVLLGPGVNIKRSPLCGRNFEYYSEDPILSGVLASSFIKGLQEKGIGCSLKHFAVNSQEKRRMISNSCIDERTLHEIYLKAFEIVVKNATPWTVMASYNLINGKYACENPYLLKHILRDMWKYQGLVMTDWGGLNKETISFQNGMNLEMPGLDKTRTKRIYKDYKKQLISEEEINQAVLPILELHQKVENEKLNDYNQNFDYNQNYEVARNVANECAVLLKNDNNILPLNKEEKVLFVGGFIKHTRYQGNGSSNINPYKLTTIQDALQQSKYNYNIVEGFSVEEDIISEELENETLQKVKEFDKIVFVGGLPLAKESEGYDRINMDLPNNQISLFNKISNINSNTILVLEGGSPVIINPLNNPKAIILPYLAGEAAGDSLLDLLYGKVNPSGHLAETWPENEEDNPVFNRFPEAKFNVLYEEGQYIGYRHYLNKNIKVCYPFGYGLSYASFKYDNFKYQEQNKTLCIDVINESSIMGKDVLQLYVTNKDNNLTYTSLKRFTKISLQPNERKTITFKIEDDFFQFYDIKSKSFVSGSGSFIISINKNANEIINYITYQNTGPIPYIIPIDKIKFDNLIEQKNNVKKYYDYNSTLLDINSCWLGKNLNKIINKIIIKYKKKNPGMDRMIDSMIMESPLRILVIGTNGKFTYRRLDGLLLMLNGHFFKGLIKLI